MKKSSAILVALSAVTPLLFCPWLQDSFDLPKLALAGFVLTVTWLAWIWRSPPWEYRVHGLEIPMGLFFLVALLSTQVSMERSTSIWGIYRVYTFGLVPLTMMLLLFQVSTQVPLARWTSSLVNASLLSAGLVGAYALLQYTGHEFLASMPVVTGGRVWATLGNAVYVGALCAMAIPLALHEMLQPGRSARRFWCGVVLFLAVAVSLLTLSRGAWLGAITGSIWTIFRMSSVRRKSVAMALAGLLVGFILMGSLIPSVRSRARIFFSTRDASNAARIEGWKGAIRIARENPWLGSGADTFVRAFRTVRSERYLRAAGSTVTQAHAHNDLLQFAATEGFLGLGAYLFLMVALIRRAWRGHPGLAGGMLALAIQSQFNFSSLSTSVWLVLWAAALPGSRCEDRPVSMAEFPGWLKACLSLVILAAAGIFGRAVWADAVFQTGRQAWVNQQPLHALEAYRTAWRMHPVELYQNELSNTINAITQAIPEGESRRQLLGEAWSSVQVLTRLQPRNPDAWNNQGVAAMWLTQMARLDRMADARRAFEEAIRLDPVFVDAWANLAKWHHLSGDLEGEKKIWSEVLRLDPSHPMARQVLQAAR